MILALPKPRLVIPSLFADAADSIARFAGYTRCPWGGYKRTASGAMKNCDCSHCFNGTMNCTTFSATYMVHLNAGAISVSGGGCALVSCSPGADATVSGSSCAWVYNDAVVFKCLGDGYQTAHGAFTNDQIVLFVGTGPSPLFCKRWELTAHLASGGGDPTDIYTLTWTRNMANGNESPVGTLNFLSGANLACTVTACPDVVIS